MRTRHLGTILTLLLLVAGAQAQQISGNQVRAATLPPAAMSSVVAWRAALSLTVGTNVPSVDGTGATGTWPISINGNAVTATTGKRLVADDAATFASDDAGGWESSGSVTATGFVGPLSNGLNSLSWLDGYWHTDQAMKVGSLTVSAAGKLASLTGDTLSLSNTDTGDSLSYTGGSLSVSGSIEALSGFTGDVTGTASGNLTSASTLDATKLSGNLPALDGASLTGLNATNLASGTVADGRLSSNVPLKNGSPVFKASADSTTAFQIQKQSDSSVIVSVDSTNKRVGIGTASPHTATMLTVAGNILSATSATTGALYVKDNSQGMRYDSATFDGPQIFGWRGVTFWSAAGGVAERMRITDSGLVGIGTTGPTYSLHVAPTSGATEGQTAMFMDATASTGRTGVVIKAGAAATQATTDQLLQIHPNNSSTPVFSVTGAGKVTATSYAGDTATLQAVLDGGGGAIPAGNKARLEVPYNCTITAWTVLADVSGSITVDVYKQDYSAYSTSAWGSAICSPAISGAIKAQTTGLSLSLTKGDILTFNMAGAATSITNATISLAVTKS